MVCWVLEGIKQGIKKKKIHLSSKFLGPKSIPTDIKFLQLTLCLNAGSLNMVQRLCILRKLPIHNGCVNCICWSPNGEYLLSGSDDHHLVVTNTLKDFKVRNVSLSCFYPIIWMFARGSSQSFLCFADTNTVYLLLSTVPIILFK